MSSDIITKVDIHYIKNNDFKTHYTTGAIAAITPNAKINLDFYIDRATIPLLSELQVGENGNYNEVIKEGKTGIVREVSTGLLLDLSTSIAIRDLLTSRIEMLEEEISKRNKQV